MKTLVWVALGGALGSVARYGVGAWVAARWSGALPWGTLLVNVVGAALIGCIAQATLPGAGRWAEAANATGAREFLIVGVLGGFTTFSAFSWQTLELIRDGAGARAALYVALSVLLCLAAVWAGARVGAAVR